MSALATTAGTPSAIYAAKDELRRRLRSLLAAISEDELLRQAAAVTARVISHPAYQSAKKVSIYVSMPTGELRTDAIIEHALTNNKQVFIPYIPPGKNTRMRMLALDDLSDFRNNLLPDKWKIRGFHEHSSDRRMDAMHIPSSLSFPAKAETTTPVTASGGPLSSALDLILMPGVAFDHASNRLGHGKGYYDTYLSDYTWYCETFSQKRPYTIALALDEQVLKTGESIPAVLTEGGHGSGSHRDIKPDEIISPNTHLRTLQDSDRSFDSV